MIDCVRNLLYEYRCAYDCTDLEALALLEADLVIIKAVDLGALEPNTPTKNQSQPQVLDYMESLADKGVLGRVDLPRLIE